jgi:hypothetical protein
MQARMKNLVASAVWTPSRTGSGTTSATPGWTAADPRGT